VIKQFVIDVEERLDEGDRCIDIGVYTLNHMGFHRATRIEASTRVANGVGIGASKSSRHSKCTLMHPC